MSDNNKELQKFKENQIILENLPELVNNSDVPAEGLLGVNNVTDLLAAFAQYLEISKRIGSNTKACYLSNVKQFLIWSNKLPYAIQNVTNTQILRNLVICYEKALSSTDLAQNSRALKHASVRKFFEFFGFMHEDYNLDLRKCFSPDWISTADQNAYKKQARINADVFNAIKEQADLGDINDKWIFFFLAFGCRRSEITTVKVNDIDMLNKEINVYQPKTGSTKKFPIPVWLTSDDVLNRKHIFLIYNTSKKCAKTRGTKKVSEKYIWLKVKRWIAKTEFKNVDITPHSFRRYMINSLLRQGASDSNISKVSGHSGTAMISKYGYDISLESNPIIKNNQVKY